MINSTVTRLVLAVAVVSLITAATWGFRSSVESTICELPQWDINDFPMEFENWKGQEGEMSEELFEATEADVVMNRNYVNSNHDEIALHVALFRRTGKGLTHQPPLCYSRIDWRPKELVPMYLQNTDGKELKIYARKWEKDGKTKLVVYWYQFGDHIVFNRFDMGLARLKMHGTEVWPAVIKVLLDFPLGMGNGIDEDTKVKEFAQKVFNWTNEQDQNEESKPSPR
jgi:EpsI family protein